MTSDSSIAIKLPDLDRITDEYSFILTLEELEAILDLGVNQRCTLLSIDGEAFRDDYGVLDIRYKNPGGHRFASISFEKAKHIIENKVLDYFA